MEQIIEIMLSYKNRMSACSEPKMHIVSSNSVINNALKKDPTGEKIILACLRFLNAHTETKPVTVLGNSPLR